MTKQHLIERLTNVRDEEIIRRITAILQNAFPEIMLDFPSDLNSKENDDDLPFPNQNNDIAEDRIFSDSNYIYDDQNNHWDGSNADDDWDLAESNSNSGCPFCGRECYCNYGLESTT
ncbi:MAG: hypothetical protein WBB32_04105 [Flavobacteriales bacterium]